jgi:putative serine protease PepD
MGGNTSEGQTPYGPAYGQPQQPAAQQPTNQTYQQPTAQQPTVQQSTSQTYQQPTTQQPPVGGGQVPPTSSASYASPLPSEGPEKGKGGKGHHKVPVGVWAVVGGVVGALALFGILSWTGAFNKTNTTSSSSAGQTINISTADGSTTTTAKAVSAKCLPSVVSITVEDSTSEGIGSGVILDTSGNILTNYHVVEGAQTITVTIDGNSYDGTVVGSDESSDIAVVKVDLNGATVTPIEVGDSSSLVVGDWVMAIGSPFGLDQSCTQGIVSSVYRSTLLSSSSNGLSSSSSNTIYTNLIQTDAAINPGNSGGALVNDQGQLVGINSIIESESGSSSGVGFAIPSNYAVKVAKQIIAGETVTHPYLGVSVGTVTANNAKSNNLSVNQGAYVSSVSEGSPAATAGIEKGDVITSIDGEEISSADAVILAVRSHEIGDTVTVKVMRGSQEMSFDVTLGSDEGTEAASSNNSSSSSNSSSSANPFGNGSSNGYGSNGYGSNGYGSSYGSDSSSYGSGTGSYGTGSTSTTASASSEDGTMTASTGSLDVSGLILT